MMVTYAYCLTYIFMNINENIRIKIKTRENKVVYLKNY